tara:strand:+ start:310 stop:447 length:138 start_codon:yes stop_codon:yes gene_type:complete
MYFESEAYRYGWSVDLGVINSLARIVSLFVKRNTYQGLIGKEFKQ